MQLVHVHQFLAWASYSIARQFNHIVTVYGRVHSLQMFASSDTPSLEERVYYQADNPRHILDPGLSHDGSDTFFLSVSVHSFFFAPFTSELSQLPKRCMYWKRKKNECEICNTLCLTPVKLRVVSYWDIFFLHFTFLDSFLCKHGRE